MSLTAGLNDTTGLVQDIKATSDGALYVTQAGNNADIVTNSYVLFADGATINTEALLTLTTPTNLQSDAMYCVTIHNPSLVSDLGIELLNLETMNTPNYPLGTSKNGVLTSWTVPKTGSGLRDTYCRLIQGAFLSASSKLSVKNLTALTAVQVQTLTRNATAFSAGTWTVSVVGTNGSTFTSSALAWDIDNNGITAALTALVAAAGYTKSTDGSAITVTSSGANAFKDASGSRTLTFSDCGTTIVPLFSNTTSGLTGAGTSTPTQTAVGAIRLPIIIRKV